jgi:hypothetical protein
MNKPEHAFHEMRGQERIEVRRSVLVLDQQTGSTLGNLVNYSEDGMMIMGVCPVEENRIFQVELVFGESSTPPIELGIESLWTQASPDQGRHWTGFYIIDISPEARRRMEELNGPG